MFTSLRFWWKTKIRPCFVPHYWCTFWNWITKKYDTGWYILDHKGRMIPWVHFGNNCLICQYEDMITPIEPPV
jgi:hypothetical protein